MSREEMCNAKVTLDGKRAKVSGIRNRFATVRDMETGLAAEWSWAAVERIISKGGAFKS